MLMLIALVVVAVFSGLITRLFKLTKKDEGTDPGMGFMLGGVIASVFATLYSIGCFVYFGAPGAFWFWLFCGLYAIAALGGYLIEGLLKRPAA